MVRCVLLDRSDSRSSRSLVSVCWLCGRRRRLVDSPTSGQAFTCVLTCCRFRTIRRSPVLKQLVSTRNFGDTVWVGTFNVERTMMYLPGRVKCG